MAYYFDRQFDQALRTLREALEFGLNPEGLTFPLGMIYREKGMYEEAIAEFRKAADEWETHMP